MMVTATYSNGRAVDVLGNLGWCDQLTEEAILSQADARIERHRKGDAVLTLLGRDGQPLPAGTRVAVEQTRHKFLFGANIYKFDDCRTPEQNAAYKQRFRELLNFATVRFYWVSYEIEEGKLEFADRLKIARWCWENGITPKGHPLFWSECQPEWLQRKDPAEAEALAWSRIGREISAFRDVIDIWDVLNEPTKGIQHARELNAVTALRIYERYGTVEVGGKAGRTYPWGNEPPNATRADFPIKFPHPVPVDYFPNGATPEGVFQMAGNSAEWCADYFDPASYVKVPPGGVAVDPTGPAQGFFPDAWYKFRVVFKGWCKSNRTTWPRQPTGSRGRSTRNHFCRWAPWAVGTPNRTRGRPY
jgi:hypothetical protein